MYLAYNHKSDSSKVVKRVTRYPMVLGSNPRVRKKFCTQQKVSARNSRWNQPLNRKNLTFNQTNSGGDSPGAVVGEKHQSRMLTSHFFIFLQHWEAVDRSFASGLVAVEKQVGYTKKIGRGLRGLFHYVVKETN